MKPVMGAEASGPRLEIACDVEQGTNPEGVSTGQVERADVVGLGGFRRTHQLQIGNPPELVPQSSIELGVMIPGSGRRETSQQSHGRRYGVDGRIVLQPELEPGGAFGPFRDFVVVIVYRSGPHKG